MVCAHTVRKLKPGTFEQFKEAFRPEGDALPDGLVRFYMLRGLGDENEVITFGFFEGTKEDLERTQEQGDYGDRLGGIAPFVESVVVNGVYDVVEEFVRG
jgi:hypothetical protein